MIFLSDLEPKERRDYGFARVRDLAFDAVRVLWTRRQKEGWQQSDIVRNIDSDPGWVSKKLRSPGNWTLRTFGELVEALDGEVEIIAHAKEDIKDSRQNHSAYDGYGPSPARSPLAATQNGNSGNQTIGASQHMLGIAATRP
jgi:hypothetical protein